MTVAGSPAAAPAPPIAAGHMECGTRMCSKAPRTESPWAAPSATLSPQVLFLRQERGLLYHEKLSKSVTSHGSRLRSSESPSNTVLPKILHHGLAQCWGAGVVPGRGASRAQRQRASRARGWVSPPTPRTGCTAP